MTTNIEDEETIARQEWEVPRQLKIELPASHQHEGDLSVTFQIEERGRDEFWKIFEEYLKFCEQHARLWIKREIKEPGTGFITGMTIVISGARAKIGPELQRIGPLLMKHSVLINPRQPQDV